MVTFFTTTLVDFEFKVIASSTYSGAQLAAYFGYFSAVVGALALGLQLFGTSRILQRAGVIGALAMLPGSLLLGNFSLILFPVLWAAATAKGADSLFRYSVNDATTQILYLPVPSQVRAAAKTFIDSVVKPASIASAGLVLAGYRAWGSGSPYHLAYGSFVLAGLWLLVVFSLRKKYIASLHETVKTKRLDLKSARPRMSDTAADQVLERAIQSADTQEVINALALLPHLQMVSLDHPVEALLDHDSPAVRKAALDYYAHRQSMRFANSVFRRFEDEDSTVRAAAISAFCAIGRDKAVRSVSSHLLDHDPEVRSAAITGIMKYGGLDGVLAAAEALKGLIVHTDDAMREHAARVLGSIGVKNFYQPVMQLMTDPSERVRRAAVLAASMLKSPELVLPLIYRTQDIQTLHSAVSALVSYGPSIIPTLEKILSNQHEAPALRHAAARVLGRLPSPEAIELLLSHLDEPDEELRKRVYRALARGVREQKFVLKDSRGVMTALNRELQIAFQTLHRAEHLQLHGGPNSSTPRAGVAAAKALLSSALTEKVTHAEGRIFLLLAVIYPDADMELIYSGMQDAGVDGARRRANAAELFDNLLPRDLKKRLLPLIEEIPRPERLAHVAEFYQFKTEPEQRVLVELTKDEASWVRACATWTLSALQTGDTSASVDEQVFLDGINDISPVVREIALVSLNRAAPERARKAAEGRLRDDTPAVRRQAALIATRRAAKRA
jgi:HEAT repeat protein